MGIEKEREAFENLWLAGGGNFDNFIFSEDQGKYAAIENSNLTDKQKEMALYVVNNAYLFFVGGFKQAAKAQVLEGFVLVPKKPDVDKAWSIALKRIVPPPKTNDAIQKELMCKKYVDDLYSEQDRILLDYEAMIEAQEQSHD